MSQRLDAEQKEDAEDRQEDKSSTSSFLPFAHRRRNLLYLRERAPSSLGPSPSPFPDLANEADVDAMAIAPETPSVGPLSPPDKSLNKPVQRQRRWQACVLAVLTFIVASILLFFFAMHGRPRHPLAPWHTASLQPQEVEQATAPPRPHHSDPMPLDQIDMTTQEPGAELPSLPDDVGIVQLRPCKGTRASVPIIVSENWNASSTATSAYITQHGAANDPDRYFRYIRDAVEDDSIIMSPGLFKTNVASAPEKFYQPDKNLAWESGKSSWPAGDDAVAPQSGTCALNGVSCSSYDVYDALLRVLADKSRYPRLQNVFLVGHSGGANIISRYSQVHDEIHKGAFHLRYIVANAAHQAYFTEARPNRDIENCPEAFAWPYQFADKGGDMPRYVKERFDRAATNALKKRKGSDSAHDLDAARSIFGRWMQRDVVLLVGARDTSAGGVQSCSARSQGGSARRNRNYAYWAMQNLVGHTDVDVNQFFGHRTLKETGAGSEEQWRASQDRRRRGNAHVEGRDDNFPNRSRDSIRFGARAAMAHQICIVSNVGHVAARMYSSDCGQAALHMDATLPVTAP